MQIRYRQNQGNARKYKQYKHEYPKTKKLEPPKNY